jgi:hypothetical protein
VGDSAVLAFAAVLASAIGLPARVVVLRGLGLRGVGIA